MPGRTADGAGRRRARRHRLHGRAGTTPEPFTADVLGRITDGIAPGVDMIMADVSSPALTRAGGVWAGMSGSPVYTSTASSSARSRTGWRQLADRRHHAGGGDEEAARHAAPPPRRPSRRSS
jgi:hypothetical protein